MAKRKIDEQISYNWLFVILAGLFSAVTVWAVYDETVSRREWKGYQEDFFEIETDLAKAEYDKQQALLDPATCPQVCPETDLTEEQCEAQCSEAQRYAQLAAEKQQIDQDLRGKLVDEIRAIEAEIAVAQEEEQSVTQDWTFTKAEWSEQDYYWRLARHHYLQDPDDSALEAAFEEEKAKWERLKERAAKEGKLVEAAIAKRKQLEAKLAETSKSERLKEISKDMEAIARPVAEAQRAWETARGRQGGLFGAATEVKQFNLPRFDAVDRCTSCHMGAERGGFEKVQETVFKSHTFRRTLLGAHPPIDFGCTSCHDGQGRATTLFYAHAPSADEDAHAFHTHYWEAPLLKGPPGGDGTEYMESKCRGCHGNEIELKTPVLCDTNTECEPLMEPENKNRISCDVPKPEGRAGAMQSFLTLPGTPEEALPGDEKLDTENKYCVDRRGNAVVVDLAPHYTAGAKTVEEVGCYGCHPIKGFEDLPKPGPDLVRIAHKIDPAYMVTWIQDPKALRPETRMPNFWPEGQNPDWYPFHVDPEAEEVEKQHESRAIAAYLLANSAASTKYAYDMEPLPRGLTANAARGKELMGSLGCAACHDLPGDEANTPERKNRASHFDYGPDLSDVGSKTTRDWIYAWIRNPKAYSPGARMPNLRLTEQEALDIATYLSELEGKADYADVSRDQLADPDLIAEGKGLVKKYGCYGCHLVEGYETEPGIGADLSAFGVKLPERLDFGDYITDHNQATWNAWTLNKLRHPRVYSYTAQSPVETLMPNFGLTEEEIRNVMVFLKSLRGDFDEAPGVLARDFTPLEQAEVQGRRLVRTYNCYGCHDVAGYEGELASLPRMSGSNSIYGPPPLTNQGFKAQPDWLFEFLKQPFRMRPLPEVRMPTFGFEDHEATSLVAMFSSMDDSQYPFAFNGEVGPESNAEYVIGKALFDTAGCQKCHVVGELGDGPVPAEVKAPNLLMGQERLRPEWLTLWIADPGALQKNTAMPAFWLASNQMEQFLQTSPEFRQAVNLLDPAIVQEYARSPQLQIQALRNFLFRMDQPPPDQPAGGSARALPITDQPVPDQPAR